jgi:hypothetical protein
MPLKNLSAYERIHGPWTMASHQGSCQRPDDRQQRSVRLSREST